MATIEQTRIRSRHFSKQRAHRAATAARAQALSERGRSSGWARLDYRVKRVRGLLRRWAVIER